MKENKYFYIKSISGQVYKVTEMPKYSNGYTVVDKAEFDKYCKELGFNPYN